MVNPSVESKKIAGRVTDFVNKILERHGKSFLTEGQSLSQRGVVDSLFVIDLVLF